MKSEELPQNLAKWASAAVAKYRRNLLRPEYGNTQETIVRVRLLDRLVASGFQARIEVAEEALRAMILKSDLNGMKGNRGGADIVFGKQDEVHGLIEVKRGFPEIGDIGRVLKDVRRLQVFDELAPALPKYVVVVLGAAWAKRSKAKVEEGLRRWREFFGAAVMAEEIRVGMISNTGDDCWVTLVIDASKVPKAPNGADPAPGPEPEDQQ